MSLFGRVTPGTSASQSPAKKAAWLNAVSQSTEYFQQQVANGQSSSGTAPLHGLVNPIKVRNLTDANRVRGDVVQIGDYLLTPFDPRNPWFQGTVYDAAEPRPIAILVKAAPEDEIVEVAITGLCVARVDVQSTSDRYAAPEDGQTVLKSSSSAGAIEIISPLSTTGVQEAFVLIGGGGSGSPTYYAEVFKTVPPHSRKQDCAYLKRFVNDAFFVGFQWVWANPDAAPEDPDYYDVVTIGIYNDGYNPITGYEHAGEHPADPSEPIEHSIYIPVRSADRFTRNELAEEDIGDEEAEPQDFDYLIVTNFDLASLPGTAVETLDGKPQGPHKPEGSRLFYNDGGPCETEAP